MKNLVPYRGKHHSKLVCAKASDFAREIRQNSKHSDPFIQLRKPSTAEIRAKNNTTPEQKNFQIQFF
jgi:hypothetical protein